MRCSCLGIPFEYRKPMSSDGTSIDALESGDVSNTADAGRMAAILRDMNSSGADVPNVQQQQPLPPQLSLPPPQPARSLPPVANYSQQYVEEGPRYVQDEPIQTKKKNIWTTIFDSIRDPLFVAILFFTLSLPAIHTFLGKYATWAFAVGGQLSWLGLFSLSAVAAIVFALYRGASSMLGM